MKIIGISLRKRQLKTLCTRKECIKKYIKIMQCNKKKLYHRFQNINFDSNDIQVTVIETFHESVSLVLIEDIS